MIPLTSQQMHCMARPRRGNRVHKLTANFRDPKQLEHAYYRLASIQTLAKAQAVILSIPTIKFYSATATPANEAEL